VNIWGQLISTFLTSEERDQRSYNIELTFIKRYLTESEVVIF